MDNKQIIEALEKSDVIRFINWYPETSQPDLKTHRAQTTITIGVDSTEHELAPLAKEFKKKCIDFYKERERQETVEYIKDIMDVNKIYCIDDFVKYFIEKREKLKTFINGLGMAHDDHWDNIPKEFDGVIIKHNGGEAWGEVAIKTPWGGYAITKCQQDWAKKHIGESVRVTPDFSSYKTVSLVLNAAAL